MIEQYYDAGVRGMFWPLGAKPVCLVCGAPPNCVFNAPSYMQYWYCDEHQAEAREFIRFREGEEEEDA